MKTETIQNFERNGTIERVNLPKPEVKSGDVPMKVHVSKVMVVINETQTHMKGDKP